MFRQALRRHDWAVHVDTATDRVLRRYRHAVTEGEYPAPTQIGHETTLNFEFVKTRFLRRDARLSLVLRDVAGAELDPASEDRALGIYEKHFAGVRGVLLLVDSTTHPSMQWRQVEFLESVINKLKEIVFGRRQKQVESIAGFGGRSVLLPTSDYMYLAICLTKCDTFPETWRNPPVQLRALATPSKLKQIIGPDAYLVLQDFSKTPGTKMRLFACSAVGYIRDGSGEYLRKNGLCASQHTAGGLADPQRVFPESIEIPFLWLLENVWRDLYGGIDAQLVRALDGLGAEF